MTPKESARRAYIRGYFAALADINLGCKNELVALGIYTAKDAIRQGARPKDVRVLALDFDAAREERRGGV